MEMMKAQKSQKTIFTLYSKYGIRDMAVQYAKMFWLGYL